MDGEHINKIIFLFITILTITGCTTASKSAQDNFVCQKQDAGIHCIECDIKKLSDEQLKKFKDYLGWSTEHIVQNLEAPPKDGHKYNGRVVFSINKLGVIQKVNMVKKSGHNGLDAAIMNAIFKTKLVPVPTDLCLSHLFYKRLFILSYDETDMS